MSSNRKFLAFLAAMGLAFLAMASGGGCGGSSHSNSDIADVNAVVDYILGNDADRDIGDINGDGEVNIADINAIINMILTQD